MFGTQSTDIHISAHPNAAKALSGLVGESSVEGLAFFSLPVELGPEGVKDVHSLGQTTDYEKKLLEACVSELKGNIEKVSPTSLLTYCHIHPIAYDFSYLRLSGIYLCHFKGLNR